MKFSLLSSQYDPLLIKVQFLYELMKSSQGVHIETD